MISHCLLLPLEAISLKSVHREHIIMHIIIGGKKTIKLPLNALFPHGVHIIIFVVLTDGCGTGSTGVTSTIQTTQSSRGALSNLHLQYREETQVRCIKGPIRRVLTTVYTVYLYIVLNTLINLSLFYS